jgi:peptidoglycan/LPS O-acetylase OafA/YrhL
MGKETSGVRQQHIIPALTGMRFFAALSILVCHCITMSGFASSSPIYLFRESAAQIGMTLFFVLSGFVLFLNYGPQFASRPWREITRSFFVARFARLYPLYAFCLFVMVLWKPWDISIDALMFVPLLQSWTPTIGHGGFLPTKIALMHHSWSISTEMYFYVWFPVIALALVWWLRQRNPFTLAAVVFMLTVAIGYLAFKVADANILAGDQRVIRLFWFAFYSPYVRVFEFLLGCIAAACFVSLSQTAPSRAEARYGRLIQALALASVLAIVAVRTSEEVPIGWNIRNFVDFLANNYLYAGPFAVLLFCACRYSTAFSTFLSLRPIVLGGELSYSIYMLHWPLVLQFAPGRPPFDPNIGDYALFLCRCAAFMSLTIVASYGTYRLIEVPGRRYIRTRFEQARRRSIEHGPPAANAV